MEIDVLRIGRRLILPAAQYSIRLFNPASRDKTFGDLVTNDISLPLAHANQTQGPHQHLTKDTHSVHTASHSIGVPI